MDIHGALLLTLLMSGPGQVLAAELPLSTIPYRQQDILVANLENAVRTLVRADQPSGVSQIQSLMLKSDVEELWAFVPSIEMWIEIGRNESVTELDSEVETDTEFLEKIVHLYHSVTIFHFHPAGFFRRAWKGEPYPLAHPAEALAGEQSRPIGFALPSPNDTVGSIELSRLLSASDPESRITYAVVSPYGVVTYGPTVSGLAAIAYDWGNPRAMLARSIVTRLAIRRLPFNVERTVGSLNDPSIGDVIAALCAQASDETYRLRFDPFIR